MTSDQSTRRTPHGFYLDDVKVQSCRAVAQPGDDLIVKHGLEATRP
jgi:hypothetical protein